jgi:hypothetical protein
MICCRRLGPRFPVVLFACAVVLGAAADLARAQDAHYWTEQYGTRESLLGGAVVGSVEGLPAVFYNPSRLVAGERTSFALSTHVFGWASISVENGASPGVDLSATRTGLEPSLVAGSLPFGSERQA